MWKTLTRWSMLSLVLAASACVGDDPTRRDVVDATGPDADVVAEVEVEVADASAGEDDAGPALPPGTSWVEGRVVPPGGASAAGWRVVNRYGEATLGADGAFVLPIGDEAPTLTIALPPEAGDARLAALTARSQATSDAHEALRIDARSTALATLLLHPRVTPQAPWRLAPLGELAAGLGTTDALALAIEAAGGGAWRDDAAVIAAYRAALDALLRRASPPWDHALATDLPPDPEGLVTLRPEVPLAALTRTATGEMGVIPLPGRPPALAVTVTPLDARGVGLADVLAGVEMEAIGEAWTVAGPWSLDEGLYRVTLTIDEPACAERVASAGDALVAVGQDSFTIPARDLVEALGAIEPGVALVADPDHPLAAVIDPRRGPTREELVVVVGDPFTPRFDAPMSDATRPLAAGAPIAVTGRHLERLVVRDAAGRRRAPRVGASGPTVPTGLAGLLVLEAWGAGATAELPLGIARVEVARVTPDRVAASSGLVRVEVDGAGFHPGTEIDLGASRVTVPADATPERFAVTIDADALAPGGDGGPLRVVGAPVVTAGPERVAGGASAAFTTADATADLVVSATIDGVAVPLPLRLTTDALVVVDTAALPAGAHTLTFENAAGHGERALTIVRPAPTYAREVRFGADDLLERQAYLSTALELVNGETVAHGEFWLYDTLVVAAEGWYCPLDIRPDTAVIARACTHWSGVCPDLWAWADTRDPASWFTVTPPPGRLTTGAEHCPPVAGPASWSGVARSELADVLTSDDEVFLQGRTVRGPNVTLVLPEARNGGLVVAPPRPEVAGPGARNEVVLDLVVADATGTAEQPVVTLEGATGVTIRRLEIHGRPGACAVGLRVRDSRDVTIERLDVRDCAVGLEVTGSRDVRIGAPPTLAAPWPVTIVGAATGLVVDASEDVYAHVAVGLRAGVGTGVVVGQAASQLDGVLVRASERVAVAGTVAATSGVAVRMEGVRHGRVGPLVAGFVKTLDDMTMTAGAGVGTGLVIEAGTSGLEDVIVRDVRIDQIKGDAIVSRGGARVRVERSRVGDVVGAIGGAGLRVAFGFAHDLDVDGLEVRGAKAGGIVVAGSGRVDIRRSAVTMSDGAACALVASGADGLALAGVTLVGDLCASLASDLRGRDVDAREVRIEGSAGVHLERARAERVAVSGSAGVVLRDVDAGSVRVTGPLVDQPDPVVLIGGELTDEGDALAVASTRVPVVIDGLAVDAVRAEDHADLRVVAAAGARVTTVGGGALVVSGEVGAIASEGGDVAVSGHAAAVTAHAGRLALVDADVTGAVTASDAQVIAAGARLSTLDVTRGRVIVTRAALTGELVLTEVEAARVEDVDAGGGVVLDGGAGARLARVTGAVTRRGAARAVRVVDGPGLVAAAGDPRAAGRTRGDAVVVEAAPTHALVELIGGSGVVARALASGGRAVFPDVGPGPWAVVTTLLDGTSGPTIALADPAPATCDAPAATPAIVELIAREEVAGPCAGVAEDVTPSPDCAWGARIVDGALVIVDLGSGTTIAPDPGAEARWPSWEADGSGLWIARRARVDEPWSLARFDVSNDHMEVVVALPEDLAWPAPSPRGPLVVASRCGGRDDAGEPTGCRLVFVDRDTRVLAAPADGGWPGAGACDERRARWLGGVASEALGDGLVVERRPFVDDGAAADVDVLSPLGLGLWRLGPLDGQAGR
ncbi:MAG: hypothetical protein IT385_05995 [Deltaproteobacteria bacterium]|nr:hypothetical protein [Deltaproteobacteria bacterium]